jgi:hypothetical protein
MLTPRIEPKTPAPRKSIHEAEMAVKSSWRKKPGQIVLQKQLYDRRKILCFFIIKYAVGGAMITI